MKPNQQFHKGNPFTIRYLRILPLTLIWIVLQTALYGYIHLNGFGQFIANHLPVGSVFFLVIFAFLLNPILSRFGSTATFSTAELTLCWAMVTAAASVPGYGLMEFIFPYIAAPAYFATPENQWAELILPHLKEWLYVTDQSALSKFWIGINRHEPIPWWIWARPVTIATIFGLSFFFSVCCWAVILRRQWADRVRYTFPLVQVAANLTQADLSQKAFQPVFHSRFFIFGITLAVMVHLVRGLHQFYPFFPNIPLDYPIRQFFPNKPWRAIVDGWPLLFRLRLSVVGVTYFLLPDVAVSIWFFFLFYKFQEVAISAFTITRVNTQQQVMGAVLVLAAISAWQARKHLIVVWQKTFTGSVDPNLVDDSNEPLSYRSAMLSMIGGFIFMGGMAVIMGMSVWMVVLFILLMWILATTAAWHVSNAGCLLVNVGFTPFNFFRLIFGGRALGVHNLILLSFDRSSIPNWSSQSLMAYSIQNFRLADAHRLPSRKMRLAQWMLLAVILSAIVTFFTTLTWIHRKGAVNLTRWIFNVGPSVMRRSIGEILNPSSPNVSGILSVGIGGIIMSGLVVMRQRFLWWPLHPLGYALGVTWAPSRLWFSTLIGWAIKFLILRFGGFRAFRQGQPFFLGLILGEYFMTAAWQISALKTGVGYWGGPPS